MKFNKWTVGLAAVGVVSLASAARADERLSAVQTALSNTTISGYVDTAATWRPGTDSGVVAGVPRANIPLYSFAKNDGFSLNAVNIALDKPEDESPWAAGYHAEFMLGLDAVGVGNGIRQAYVTLRMPIGNGLDWKVGVFDTIIGYESSSDPLNPNYTRSYGYSIEPTTHTGVLATYKINDIVTLQAGVADSSNVGSGTVGVNPFAFESQKAVLGDVQFTAPDSAGWIKGATMTAAIIEVPGSTLAPGSTSLYAGLTVPTPVTALKVGAAFDYLEFHNQHNAGGTVVKNASDDSLWNVALYTTLQATDKLSFNLRAEYLDNTDASTLLNAAGNGSPGTLYANSSAFECTGTIQYNLWANVISRLEMRWDHANTRHFGFSQNPGAIGSANRRNDLMMALNLIYQF